MQQHLRIVVISITLALLPHIAWAGVSYSFQQLDFPTNAFFTVAYGISNDGRIAGQYRDSNSHGFTFHNGVYTSFNTSPTIGTTLLDINSSHQVVGSLSSGSTGSSGIPFSMPGAASTSIWRINDDGLKLIKATFDPPGPQRPFGKDYLGTTAGDATEIAYPDVPGDRYSAFGLSESGAVVGQYLSGNQVPQGFLFDGTAVESFLFPGSLETLATGVNESGQVVGGYRLVNSTLTRNYHSFLYNHGSMTTFDYPGALGTLAYDINDIGQIVGVFVDNSGLSHGFLATPVSIPEPNILSLLGLVIAMMILCRKQNLLATNGNVRFCSK